MPTEYEQKEQDEWQQRIRDAEHLFIVVHSEGPSHYAYLEIHKIWDGEGVSIEYRDSLKVPSEAAHEAATRILRKLELIPEGESCPSKGNVTFQKDVWSCGLWSTRWFERSLRELRGEARAKPLSLERMVARGNEFLEKIQSAGIEPKAVAKAEPKAKDKPKKVYKQVEPVYETFEEALEAAKDCKKCLPTKFGTKGCRACMGEHFEQIRLKHPKT